MCRTIHRFLAVISIASACVLPVCAQGEAGIVWRSSAKGPFELGDRSSIRPLGLVCDDTGRTYVVGLSYCQGDAEATFVAAHDSAGSELWRTEVPTGWILVRDSRGDLIVGGQAVIEGHVRAALAKVRRDGTFLWSLVEDAPADEEVWLGRIAVGPNGTIYGVSSRSCNAPRQSYSHITAVTPEGTIKWRTDYNSGAEYVNETPSGITTDAEGNVYMTTASAAKEEESDYAVVKYTPAGERLWAARYRNPAFTRAHPTAIAVAPDGGVVVIGTHYSDDMAVITVKYDAAGNLVFDALLPDVQASALGLDAAGNPYVSVVLPPDAVDLVKYSAAGAFLWSSRLSVPLWNWEGARLGVDGNNNPVIALHAGIMETDLDLHTAKYDAAGNLLWHVVFDQGAGYNDFLSGFAVTAGGRIAMSCTSMVSTAPLVGHTVLQYAEDGAIAWRDSVRDNTAVDETPGALAIDPSGAIYVAATSTDFTTREDFLVSKYTAEGAPVWQRRLARAGISAEEPRAIGLDAAGNAYVAGMIEEDQQSASLLLAKYTPAGDLAWSIEHSEHAWSYYRLCGAAVTPAGDMYVVGRYFTYTPPEGSTVILVLKIDADGNQTWHAEFAVDGTLCYDPVIALAPDDSVYFALAAGPLQTAYTLRYLPDGTRAWAYQHPCPAGTFPGWVIRPAALCIDAGGNACVASSFYYEDGEDLTSSDVLVRSLTPDGELNWEARYKAPPQYRHRPHAVAAAPDGDVLVTLAAAGDSEVWSTITVAFDTLGSRRWEHSYRHGTSLVTVPRGLAIGAAGEVTVLALAESMLGDWNGALPVLLRLGRDGDQTAAVELGALGTVKDFVPQSLALMPGGDAVVALGTTHDGPCFLWPRTTLARIGEVSALGRFIRGDASGDAVVNIADAICALGYLFGPPGAACKQPTCLDALDANDDEVIDIADPIRVLGYLFAGGPPPPFPGPVACGRDTTGAALDCATHPACPAGE